MLYLSYLHVGRKVYPLGGHAACLVWEDTNFDVKVCIVSCWSDLLLVHVCLM